MVNSRAKGSRGELEFANWLKARGVDARRSQQYCGVGGDGDLQTDLPFHFEIKRVEALNINKAMAQAIGDSAESALTPVVCHRKDRGEWLITMRAEDWFGQVVKKQEGT